MFKNFRYLLPVIIVMLFSVAASAQAVVSYEAPEASPVSAQGNSLTDDPGSGNTDHCGEVLPNEPCYSSGGGKTEVCIDARSYDTCISKCNCEYRKNAKKCNASPVCINLVRAERSACYGACLTDWT